MSSKFTISAELLAYMLDLPAGAQLGAINRVPCGNGKHVYEVSVNVPDWPEGQVELVYSRNEDESVILEGVVPVV